MDVTIAKETSEPLRILDAAIDALAEYGYATCSMQRIADHAEVDKRMLHYYFGDRNGLIEQVAVRVGDRLLAGFTNAIEGLSSPREIAAAGFESLWSNVVSEPRLHAVHLGLVSAAVTDDSLRPRVARIRDRYRELILELAERAREAGLELRLNDETLAGLILAGLNGLTVDYLQRGETEELSQLLVEFQSWLKQLARPLADA
ncbi:MAG: TetR/AcrR family transcriptional regulator [Solirubrobacterales bacterium]